jgi:hypothetical protein
MVSGVITVYLGNGSGGRCCEARSPVSDLDGDGALDLLAVNLGDWEYWNGCIAAVAERDRPTATLLRRFDAVRVDRGIEVSGRSQRRSRVSSCSGPRRQRTVAGVPGAQHQAIWTTPRLRTRPYFYRLAVRFNMGPITFAARSGEATSSAGELAMSRIAPIDRWRHRPLRGSASRSGPRQCPGSSGEEGRDARRRRPASGSPRSRLGWDARQSGRVLRRARRGRKKNDQAHHPGAMRAIGGASAWRAHSPTTSPARE